MSHYNEFITDTEPSQATSDKSLSQESFCIYNNQEKVLQF